MNQTEQGNNKTITTPVLIAIAVLLAVVGVGILFVQQQKIAELESRVGSSPAAGVGEGAAFSLKTAIRDDMLSETEFYGEITEISNESIVLAASVVDIEKLVEDPELSGGEALPQTTRNYTVRLSEGTVIAFDPEVHQDAAQREVPDLAPGMVVRVVSSEPYYQANEVVAVSIYIINLSAPSEAQ